MRSSLALAFCFVFAVRGNRLHNSKRTSKEDRKLTQRSDRAESSRAATSSVSSAEVGPQRALALQLLNPFINCAFHLAGGASHAATASRSTVNMQLSVPKEGVGTQYRLADNQKQSIPGAVSNIDPERFKTDPQGFCKTRSDAFGIFFKTGCFGEGSSIFMGDGPSMATISNYTTLSASAQTGDEELLPPFVNLAPIVADDTEEEIFDTENPFWRDIWLHINRESYQAALEQIPFYKDGGSEIDPLQDAKCRGSVRQTLRKLMLKATSPLTLGIPAEDLPEVLDYRYGGMKKVMRDYDAYAKQRFYPIEAGFDAMRVVRRLGWDKVVDLIPGEQKAEALDPLSRRSVTPGLKKKIVLAAPRRGNLFDKLSERASDKFDLDNGRAEGVVFQEGIERFAAEEGLDVDLVLKQLSSTVEQASSLLANMMVARNGWKLWSTEVDDERLQVSRELGLRPDDPFMPEHLDKMPKLHNYILEVMRYCPVARPARRVLESDLNITVRDGTRVDDFALKAGQVLCPEPWLAHFNLNHYVFPTEFDPGRWEGNKPSRRMPLIPFATGPNSSLGEFGEQLNEKLLMYIVKIGYCHIARMNKGVDIGPDILLGYPLHTLTNRARGLWRYRYYYEIKRGVRDPRRVSQLAGLTDMQRWQGQGDRMMPRKDDNPFR